jgi:hypothetical protein
MFFTMMTDDSNIFILSCTYDIVFHIERKINYFIFIFFI